MSSQEIQEGDHSDRGGFEKFISALERFGLNVARLLLGVTITAAVFGFLLVLIAIIAAGVEYHSETGAGKYVVSTIQFVPQFSNVLLNKKPQNAVDTPIAADRNGAMSKTRDQLISDRLAYASEVGVCYGGNEHCHDLAYQRKAFESGWRSDDVHLGLPEGSSVAYGKGLETPDISPYYGSYGFGSQDDALKAEWDAVNSCLSAYSAKNGNLYIQKAPELFNAIEAQCDHDYNKALFGELSSRPKNWTLADTERFFVLVWTLVGLGSTIILIALTTLFFRLEVSFRALRNLNRLR